MSNMNDARDPYVGLNNHIRKQAQEQVPSHYVVGKVLSLHPILIRAAGMDLDKEDLLVAQHLIPYWEEYLKSLSWPLTARLPQATFTGTCSCGLGGGTCQVTRPQETVSGQTAERASVSHEPYLIPGDQVLLIPSADGQTYYLVEKMVPWIESLEV